MIPQPPKCLFSLFSFALLSSPNKICEGFQCQITCSYCDFRLKIPIWPRYCIEPMPANVELLEQAFSALNVLGPVK